MSNATMNGTKPPTETSVAIERAPAPMALANDNTFRMALEPSTFEQALAVGARFASIGLCGCSTAEDALARIMTGRELGLSAMASMRGIYTVNGRTGIDASLMMALCLVSPLCEEFKHIETTLTQSTFRAKRRGHEAETFTFTVEDAQRAGLLGRGGKGDGNYEKWLKQMLAARSKSNLARLVFPDLMFGLYTREEIENFEVAAESSDEMVGEVVQSKPPTDVPARDWAAESAALLARINAPLTKESARVLRKDIAEWDGAATEKATLVTAYEARMAGIRAAAEAKKKEAEAAAASAGREPGSDDT